MECDLHLHTDGPLELHLWRLPLGFGRTLMPPDAPGFTARGITGSITECEGRSSVAEVAAPPRTLHGLCATSSASPEEPLDEARGGTSHGEPAPTPPTRGPPIRLASVVTLTTVHQYRPQRMRSGRGTICVVDSPGDLPGSVGSAPSRASSSSRGIRTRRPSLSAGNSPFCTARETVRTSTARSDAASATEITAASLVRRSSRFTGTPTDGEWRSRL